MLALAARTLYPLAYVTGPDMLRTFVFTVGFQAQIVTMALSLFDGLTLLGWISAVTWGLGYFGQPHIIVRFMAVRSVPAVATARNIGMTWMAISLIGAVGVGVFWRAYAVRNGVNVEDSETLFIVLADLLFHPLVTGFLYAALLAAIMSTVSSQLLVASSSLAEDFYRLFVHRDALPSTQNRFDFFMSNTFAEWSTPPA